MRWPGAVVTATLFAALPARGQALRPLPARCALIVERDDAMEGLSAAERNALRRGDTVTHPTLYQRADELYFGGVAYQVVHASPEEVLSAMTNPKQLLELLPSTREARWADPAGSAPRIELVSGTALVNARYTLRFRRVSGDELRFWLDPSRPHGIRDVWGFVRVRALGPNRSLLTVGVALDVAPLVRMLLGEDIQETILSTPRQVRDVFERPRAQRAN